MNLSGWREFWEEFRESKSGLFGAGLTLVLILAALFAPLISPQNPYDLTQLFLEDSNLAPQWVLGKFMLGSDGQGRDLYSAILYGLRVSLYVACPARCFRPSSAP